MNLSVPQGLSLSITVPDGVGSSHVYVLDTEDSPSRSAGSLLSITSIYALVVRCPADWHCSRRLLGTSDLFEHSAYGHMEN